LTLEAWEAAPSFRFPLDEEPSEGGDLNELLEELDGLLGDERKRRRGDDDP
jgi:hypothetical protein